MREYPHGTALFAKVFRIVLKWYGNPTAKEVLPQIMEDALIAWQTGYFEGVAVFRAEDPGDAQIAQPKQAGPESDDSNNYAPDRASKPEGPVAAAVTDPNTAAIRVDLSGIGGR